MKLAIYLCVVSIVAVIVCCYDKIAAIYNKRRISEKSLLIISALGGSLAMYIVMRIIKHKTRHNKFMIGIPLIFLVQLLIIFVFYYKILLF